MQQAKAGAMVRDHSHDFELTPEGGFIAMQLPTDNAVRVRQIRSHIKEIAELFAAGDFRLPPRSGSVDKVPGARVMQQRLADIKFSAQPIPRGSEIVMSSADPNAIAAIHEFLEFHRLEHQAFKKSKDQ